jgi:quercetin dioxygenase-like cupin family protein
VAAQPDPGERELAGRAILHDQTALDALDLGPNRVTFVLGGAETGGRYSLTAWEMAPPPAPGPPAHAHADADEAIYLLDGALDCRVGAEEIQARPGAVVLIPRGVEHALANPGPSRARFLVVLSPPGFEGYWRETAALLAGDSPPDPEVVLALQARYQMVTGGKARRF